MLTTKNAGAGAGVKGGKVDFERCGARSPFAILTILFFLCASFATVFTGCKPPGPRALLDGQRLIEHGKYADAVARLKTATSLLSTNADAWNYLGLAYHLTGQANDAVDAYKRAISLDQDLIEAHYNLGCLWLEQNRPDLAKAELTAYTLHREKSPEGWIKLGEAQLALRDLTGAERSFNQARQFEANNPEALNDMGVVMMQRNRASEAAQYFGGAVKVKPDYGPAILNLAIVSQVKLNNRQYALERYKDYLALTPRPANWDAVNAEAQALEEELNPVPTAPAVTSRVTPPPARPSPQPAVTHVESEPPARSVRTEQPPAMSPRQAAEQAPRQTPSSTSPPMEVVQVPAEPVIHGAEDNGKTSAPAQAEHRSFLSRVFHGGSKTSTPAAGHSDSGSQVAAAEPAPAVKYPRFHYQWPRKPAAGDRRAAEKEFSDGSRAQQAGQFAEAAAAYHRATQADPSYFDPYYNLGIVSMYSGNLPEALSAYETALAIEPESHDARFNFALALRRANYPLDAANELEKVLANSPRDANAHYALGNIYAEMHDAAKAREHYQKVLELNPNFPQASAIHQWLWANPG